jgi:hypothetical protein
MGLKYKVSISMGLLLAVSICVYSQISVVHSWSSETHRYITSTAIDQLMPPSFDWFFQTYSSTILEYSTKPDSWKNLGNPGYSPDEQYRHYYHVDVNYPNGHDKSDYVDGVLPWAVEDNFNAFVQYLRENDWDHAAQLAGVISHYIGDASMPLHATSNYNPGGNHTAYESTVDSHLREINMIISGFTPQELENVFNSTMQLLNDSYSYVSVLSPYLENGTLWNDNIKDITENRLRTGAQLLTNIWYTAVVQAGVSPPPANNANPESSSPWIVIIVLVVIVAVAATALYLWRS